MDSENWNSKWGISRRIPNSPHVYQLGALIWGDQLSGSELVKSNRDSVRKAREAHLIERGQTLEPHGLNKKDETLY